MAEKWEFCKIDFIENNFKFYTEQGVSTQYPLDLIGKYSSAERAISKLLADGWEPYAVIKAEDYIHFFRRRVE